MARDFEDHCWKDLIDRETLDLYTAYHRELHIGPRPALLAIDLYKLTYAGGPRPLREVIKAFPRSCGEYAWRTVEPTKALLRAARQAGLPIIYTTVEARREVNPESVPTTRRTVDRVAEDSFEILEAFTPEPGDLVIYKERASAFFGTPLIAHLTALGVRSLIMCGETTSGCVRATVADAYSYGFHSVLVEECCFDRSPISHMVNLFDMHHKYADVMHLDEVLDALAASSGMKEAV